MDDILMHAKNTPGILLRVATEMGIELRVGLQCSPFRHDRHSSFSVYRGGTRFRDHAVPEHRGSAWDFILLTNPDMKPGDIRSKLLKIAGINNDSADDYNFSSLSQKKHFDSRRKDIVARFYNKLNNVGLIPEVSEIPDFILQYWCEGRNSAYAHADKLALYRGWKNIDFVHYLVNAEKLSYPLLPWGKCNDEDRGWAFRVDYPLWEKNNVTFVAIGYHQRFLRKNNNAESIRASWIYVPYFPNNRVQNTFTKKLINLYYNENQFLKKGIPAFPFVMGLPGKKTKYVVISEGQWDAATLWFAMGLASDKSDLLASCEWTIFGIRGAQGIEPFLAGYGEWLKTVKPKILLICDNDSAGKTWIESNNGRHKKQPTFLEKLKAVTLSEVKYVYSNDDKDFNDRYKRTNPSVTEVQDLILKAIQ